MKNFKRFDTLRTGFRGLSIRPSRQHLLSVAPRFLVSDFEVAVKHQILPVTRRGDTLIITPTGDLGGYSRNLFDAELGRVRSLIGSNGMRNAIVDLSRAPYFGSEMIGSFFSLLKSAPENGTVALAGPSNDMAITLKAMRVDAVMPVYETLAEAINELSNQSLFEKLRANAYVTGVILVVLVGILLWSLAEYTTALAPLIGTHESHTCEQLLTVWDEIASLKEIRARHDDWKRFSRKVDSQLMPRIEAYRQDDKRSDVEEATYQATLTLWQATRSLSGPSQQQLDSCRVKIGNAIDLVERAQGIKLPQPTKASATPAEKENATPQESTREDS